MSDSVTNWFHQLAFYWDQLEFGREGKFAWVAGFLAVVVLVGWIYRRDTVELTRFWKVWLVSLRVMVILALLVIALEPQIPNNKTIFHPSRVALLLDTSLSMSIADSQAAGEGAMEVADVLVSRSELVDKLLAETPLIQSLCSTHEVGIYTFDSHLHQQRQLAQLESVRGAESSSRTSKADGDGSPSRQSPPQTEELDWTEIAKPRGLESRLGEALLDVIRKEAGTTLSGIVLITDGVSNAGVEPATAIKAAVEAQVRLYPVGVGSSRPPVNLQVVDVQAPTDVHVRDGFTITAYVRGQGLVGKRVKVELLSKPEEETGEPIVLQSEEKTILQDGVPLAVGFDFTPNAPGRRVFIVKVKPLDPVRELIAEDNIARVTVEASERKVKVLLVAGGPMRDYRFVRNLLFRDSAIQLDVWLQTAVAGISQESDKLLFEFPSDREDLFNYDIVIAFDPDWGRISSQAVENLSEWVFEHAGGLILVAGDVYTPAIAGAADKPEFQRLHELYPVILDPQLYGPGFAEDEYRQPWPLRFTSAGLDAGFLQPAENPATSARLWNEFAGIFHCYPTRGAKAGATVYVHFSDPRFGDGNGQPILIASQFYGSGRVLYLGSSEFWRLRALAEESYDSFWIKAIREVGQGRLLRGTTRGMLFLEKDRYPLGGTVQIRARVLDPQLKKFRAENIALNVYDPNGRPLVPPLRLYGKLNRPGDFQGAFTATIVGAYRLELPIPESKETVVKRVEVKFPNLERERPQQDVQLLRTLARQTQGRYLSIGDAARELPKLLADHSITTIQTGFPDPQWDEAWVLYLLVGLLSVEWLTRKLLKMA